jgi:hypothetical protein
MKGRWLEAFSVTYRRRFDYVNHNILLTKLEFYGVTGALLKLIKSYLEGRYQKVFLDNNLCNSNADWGEIWHSVPQGSILGALDNTFSWKNHIDTVVPKLSSACFTIRAVQLFLSQESLRMVYFSYFHSIMNYRLIFWGNSYHSSSVFKLQKRIIRIIVGIRDRDSCRKYIRKVKILPLQSEYIYFLLIFVINNRQHFKINSDIHNINSRHDLDLHCPQSHLSAYQKGAHYIGIKLFNRLPVPIKQLSHDTK